MKKKRLRPLSTKSGQKKFANSRQKWWPIIILAALLIGYLVWKNNSPDTEKAPIESTPPAAESIAQDNAVQSDTASLDNNDELALDNDSSASTDVQIPDPDAILNAPLPENDSLAKEEIDRLEDERQRLAEQEKLAAEQLAMNKQLTEMKEEQIALLEEQIAQLEAAESAKNSVK
ncbi:hypothetical protein [Psychrobacter pulmonis]